VASTPPPGGSTLARPAAPSESATLPPSGTVASHRPNPSVVTGYEILEELGRGGMGVVYKARQTALHRTVALKMILTGAPAAPVALARCRTDAQAVARLQHSNIVQIFEVGEREGMPYFSLEFVDGGSLAGRLDGDPWPAREAAELVEALARAVDYAHEQ